MSFTVLLMACSAKEKPCMVDSTLASLCVEMFSEVPDKEISNALKEMSVASPVNVHGTDYGSEDSSIYFDTRTTDDKVLHVVMSHENGEYVFQYMYDTPVEWKQRIQNMGKALVGPDATILVADRYFDSVVVTIRGERYLYKDDRLYKSE